MFWYVQIVTLALIAMQCLFRTPLNNYDAVILLHRDKLPYPQRLLFPSELHQGKFSMVPRCLRAYGFTVFSPFSDKAHSHFGICQGL
jgi:U3 small nucleolar RNA-associated protein 22